ncbi:MAG: DUF1028 domain-containing protein [Planctomycetota bacterium]
MQRLLLRSTAFLSLFFALVLPAGATWSIVIVDHRTGEVGVGTATCLAQFGIRRAVPVIVVGKGVAAAQATVDALGVNRQLIRDLLLEGAPASQILTALEASDIGHQSRQYGIVSLGGGNAVTFTGTQALAWAGGVTGEDGDWSYAIQGNILVGPNVVSAAETALLQTQGDMSERLLAAMLAARFEGGDSRCNCAPNCGVPPPLPFVSSYTSFMGIARLGDVDGTCDSNGCAEGTYYLKRQIVGQFGDPDPVDVLATRVATWRSLLIGRPDHHLSSLVAASPGVPVADGVDSKAMVLSLVDVDGTPLTTGGAQVTIVPAADSVPFTTTAVIDHGDGTYGFDVIAGTLPGSARFVVVVDDGTSPVQLAPLPELEFAPAQALSRAPDVVAAAAGGRIEFVVSQPARAGSPYVLLASASGTLPGVDLGGVVLPLNPDGVLTCTLIEANGPLLPNSFGLLDSDGEARPAFAAPPGLLTSLTGQTLHFAALLFQPLEATVTVAVSVLP